MSKELVKRNHIDLQQLLEVTKQNAESSTAMLQVVQGFVSKIGTHDEEIKEIKTYIEQIKFNEEISDEQASYISEQIRIIAKDTVGYPSQLYRLAISDIYAQLRKNWLLGGKLRRTKKGNFDSVVEGLKTYKPDIKKLQERFDAKMLLENS